MSYYMGDYYAGDPGFLSFFRKAAGFAAGFIPGVGGIASRGISAIGGGATKTIGAGIVPKVGAIVRRGTAIIAKHPVLSAAGAAGAIGVLGGGVAERIAMGGAGGAPKGFHPCKSKHGCKSGAFVRNRHMRVTNPRALRRALRRAHGFARLAMKTIHLVHPRKKARFGGFKKRRK